MEKEKKERKSRKKRWTLLWGFLFLLLAVPLISYLSLRHEKVQLFLVQRLAAHLSKEWNTHVEIGGVHATFFLNLVLTEVRIGDPQAGLHDNAQSSADLISAGRLVLDLGRISFRHNHLQINKIVFEDTHLNLVRYPGEEGFNFHFLLAYFASEEREREPMQWDLICRSFEFRRSSFSFIDHAFNLSKPSAGFNPRHFSVNDFEMAIQDVMLLPDELSFDLNFLAFNESSQFILNRLSGGFSISPDEIRAGNVLLHSKSSYLSFDMLATYENYDALFRFFDEVEISLLLDESFIDLTELSHFLPSLKGMHDRLKISGELTGTPSGLKGRGVNLSWGSHSRFSGNFSLDGLPDINAAYLDFRVNRLETSAHDLQRFRLPVSHSDQGARVPQALLNFERMQFSGSLQGYLNDFRAEGRLHTSLGSMQANLSIQQISQMDELGYEGWLQVSALDLGSMFPDQQGFGRISLDAEIKGKGLSLASLETHMQGSISLLEFSGYTYRNMQLAGDISNKRFSGLMQIRDEHIKLDFAGVIDFDQDIPLMDFQAQLQDANLSRLGIYARKPESESVISARLDMNARASSLDDMQGSILVSDLRYGEVLSEASSGSDEPRINWLYETSQISLSNSITYGDNTHLVLESDFLDADLDGRIDFAFLGTTIRSFVNYFVPAVTEGAQDEFHVFSGPLPEQYFSGLFTFKETATLSALFFPVLHIAQGSCLHIDVDASQMQLRLQLDTDTLVLAGREFHSWILNAENQGNTFLIEGRGRGLQISQRILLNDFMLDGRFAHDSLRLSSRWGYHEKEESWDGQFDFAMRFLGPRSFEGSVLDSYAWIDDELWSIRPGNRWFKGDSLLGIKELEIRNKDQLLRIDGRLGPQADDRMSVGFENFDFSYLDDILRVKDMNFDGRINGNIFLSGLYRDPGAEGELLIRDFAFNRDHLGDLAIKTLWDAEREGFRLNAEIIYYGNVGFNKPLVAQGYYYPSKEENFDLDIRIENLKLSIWARYLTSFADDFRGLASGNLRLEGPLSDPALSGRVRSSRTAFRVGYLNVPFSFAHELEIGKNYFFFENLVLNDTLGNRALVSGRITHERFRDFSLDVSLRPERMTVLNTTSAQNQYYYGRAFASGFVHIHGPANDIVMDISARANRGTQIFLPLTYSGQIGEQSFISFISPDTNNGDDVALPGMTISGITLNFDLEVSPEAEVQLIFDSQMGDIIRGRGSGNLRMEISSQGAFAMYGDYFLQEGDYLFTLQNLINKRFELRQGGSIRWTGDPYDADIELRAAYPVRTSLYDLVMEVDTSDFYRRRVRVDVILALSEKLSNPAIGFEIDIPGGDENIRELVERLITTEQEMNRQVFSLLILNRFMPTTMDQYNTALGYGVGSTSSELLSNQLSNWLSQISSDFDIGINYRPGDEISAQELEVALSTQLFDDRVTIDGNFGVAGTHPSGYQRASNIVSDFIVEVKISPEGRFRVKAFNRSNDFDIAGENAAYTQGVGVFYRREFDSLNELFRRAGRRTRLPEESAQP